MPPFLRKLVFGNGFNQGITEVEWPSSLQHLSFGTGFNRSVDGAVWPASLQSIRCGGKDLLSKACGAHLSNIGGRVFGFGRVACPVTVGFETGGGERFCLVRG